MANVSWLAGSLPARSIGKNGKFRRLRASISALAARSQREFTEVLPNFPPHPAKPAKISCLNAAKLASTAATVFVVGGEQIYCQAMAVADRLEITEVDLEPEGDAWFPEIAAVDWKKAARTEGAGFVFVTYRRRAA